MNDGLFHADNTRGMSQWFTDTCPVCGKRFNRTALHAYHMQRGPQLLMFCTWRCLRAYQAEHGATLAEVRRKAALKAWAQKRKEAGA